MSRTRPRRPWLAACLAIAVVPPARGARAQAGPYQRIAVPSCAAADSILGPIDDDVNGYVRGRYSPAADWSYIFTERVPPASQEPALSANLYHAGPGPIASPSPSVTLMLAGPRALALLDAGTPPPLTMELDDSVTIGLSMPQQGTYSGPRDRAIVPLAFKLSPRTYVRMLQAGKVDLWVGDDEFTIDRETVRDLRALYRIAVCHRLE